MLELAAPSSESSSCKERWKEFIDDPITQLCDTSEEREGFSANKAKRSFADLPMVSPYSLVGYRSLLRNGSMLSQFHFRRCPQRLLAVTT